MSHAKRAPCGEPHPVNGRPCEERAGHPWSHGYTDRRFLEIGLVGARVWWTDEEARDLDQVEAELEAARQLGLFG